jgi:hypothetical protein
MRYARTASAARQRDRSDPSKRQLSWDWHASRRLADEILAKTDRLPDRLAEVVSLVLLEIDDDGKLIKDLIAELAIEWAIGNGSAESNFTAHKVDDEAEFAVSVQVTEHRTSAE